MTPKITSRTIADYLDYIKWRYRVVDDTTLLTAFRGAVPFYSYSAPIEVTTGQHWVYLRGLLQQDVRPAYRAGVLRFVTLWNEHCHLVRFLLVQDCVVIQAEVPVIQCHAGTFMDALTAVCRYGTLTGPEISILATNRSANELYEEAAASLEAANSAHPGDSLLGGQIPDFELLINTLPD
jgi:hypothetical protein